MHTGGSNYPMADKRLLPQGRHYVAKFNAPLQGGEHSTRPPAPATFSGACCMAAKKAIKQVSGVFNSLFTKMLFLLAEVLLVLSLHFYSFAREHTRLSLLVCSLSLSFSLNLYFQNSKFIWYVPLFFFFGKYLP